MPSNSGCGARPLDLVPADVREGRGVLEPDRAPGEDAERRRAVLVAAVEQELEPEADAEERPVGGEPRADRVGQAVPVEPRHRRFGRADARDDRAHPRRAGASPSRATVDLGADGRERLVDADEVAGAVVDDRDAWPRRRASSEGPLVEATPSRRGSGSQATRSARPSALNAASARWWSLRPVPVRWSVAPAVRANDSSACSTSWSGRPPDPLAAERQVDDGVRAPADVDDGGRERLVHRDRALPKRAMPARSPSASANAAPRTSATSSTVWCSSTWRSPSASIARSNRPWWANEPRRWS